VGAATAACSRVVIVTAVLAVFTPFAVGDQAVFRAYPVYPSNAETTLELVREVIGPGGRALYDRVGSQLLVSAKPEAHQRITAILEQIDMVPRNVRLEVVIRETDRLDESGIGADVNVSKTVSPDGDSTTIHIEPRIRSRTVSGSSATRQTLVVQSGSEAVLRVGQDVPYAEWLIDIGRRYGYIEQRISMRRVGSSLRIHPQVVGQGPMVSILLTPELTGLVDGNPYRVRYAGLTTRITARDGETVSLGGTDQHREFYDKFLVGLDHAGRTRRLSITVTPRILDAPGRLRPSLPVTGESEPAPSGQD